MLSYYCHLQNTNKNGLQILAFTTTFQSFFSIYNYTCFIFPRHHLFLPIRCKQSFQLLFSEYGCRNCYQQKGIFNPCFWFFVFLLQLQIQIQTLLSNIHYFTCFPPDQYINTVTLKDVMRILEGQFMVRYFFLCFVTTYIPIVLLHAA